MADEIRTVDYFYVVVADKPGKAAEILQGLHTAGVNLVAFSGFPKGKKGQLDFIPSDSTAFTATAKKMKLDVSKKKTGFLVQGEDRVRSRSRSYGEVGSRQNQRHLHAGCLRRSWPLWRAALGETP